MKVIFIFPNGDVLIEMEMDAIPRINERVSFGEVDPSKFENDENYQKFKDEEYSYRGWIVEDILWEINDVIGNGVNVTLKEGPHPDPITYIEKKN